MTVLVFTLFKGIVAHRDQLPLGAVARAIYKLYRGLIKVVTASKSITRA